MSATQAETVALAENEIEVLRQRRAVLTKAGLQAEALEAKLTTQLADTVAENARQEFLKSELKKSTGRVEASFDALYETASGLLDAIMGVLGKNSPEAKVLQRLRSRMRMPGDQAGGAETPGEPVPHMEQ